jgi:hydrogenase maturation protease
MTSTIVIGVGHPYRRDDAVGLAVLDRLAPHGPAEMTLVASSGEATELIHAWDGADTAIIVDAVHFDAAEPGRVRRIVLDTGVPPERSPATTATSHSLRFGEVVALARALDRLPAKMIVYAIEVCDVEFGQGLSEPVEAAASQVAEQILAGTADRQRSDDTPPEGG